MLNVEAEVDSTHPVVLFVQSYELVHPLTSSNSPPQW